MHYFIELNDMYIKSGFKLRSRSQIAFGTRTPPYHDEVQFMRKYGIRFWISAKDTTAAFLQMYFH